MTATPTPQEAEQQLRSLEAEHAGLDDQARRALEAGDAAQLTAIRRRREELGDELAVADLAARRLRIEGLQAALAEARAARDDPEARTALARAQAAVPAAQEALWKAQQAAVAALVPFQALQGRIDALTAALAGEQQVLRARTAPPPAAPVPQPATRLIYGGPGRRPDAQVATPPPVPATV